MKRFQFHLEALLNFRKHLLEQAQLEVARLRTELYASEGRIEQYENDYAATGRELEEEMAAGMDVKRYRHYTRYLSGIESKIETENLTRAQLLKHLEEKQKQLLQHSIEKKGLENLKNRRREDYYRDLSAADQKAADETVIVRQVGKRSR
jgi:flagellar FliJ protein